MHHTREIRNVEAIGWIILFILTALALWGLGSLQASLMASARTEQLQAAQEERATNAALDAAIAYQPEPVRTLESLAEQVAQLELRLRALEGKGRG